MTLARDAFERRDLHQTVLRAESRGCHALCDDCFQSRGARCSCDTLFAVRHNARLIVGLLSACAWLSVAGPDPKTGCTAEEMPLAILCS
jgi:hypothetical protein